MIILPSIMLLIGRHDDHDGKSFVASNNASMAGFTYPIGNYTATNPVMSSAPAISSNADILSHTAIATSLAQSSVGNCTPYLNVVSTESLRSGSGVLDTLPSFVTATLATSAWNALRSLHWPSSSLADNIVVATSAWANNLTIYPSTTTKESFTPYLTTRPAQPSAHLSTPILTTTMYALTLSSMQNAFVDPSMFDPIIFDPGRLSSPGVQTSTLHITVTTSMSKATPTATVVKESIITSKVTSTLTKTVIPSTSFVPSASTPPSVVPSSTAQSETAPSLSRVQQSDRRFVHTSVISNDPGCPYPFPGVYCGGPKTTFITETRTGEVPTTSTLMSADSGDKTHESGLCPYPGMKC